MLFVVVLSFTACSKGAKSESSINSSEEIISSSIVEKLGVPLPYDIDKTGCINRFYADENNSVDIVIPGSYSINANGKIVSGHAYQVTKISESCFANSNLTKTVVIPNTVTEIEDLAFYNCANLEKINIPSSVSILGEKVFDKCPKLIKLSAERTIGAIELSENDNLRNFNIPDTIYYLDNNVFTGWDKLYTLTLGENITFVGGGCIRNCAELSSVTIKGVLSDLGNSSLQGCPKLTKLTFEQIPTIKKYTVPDSITGIGTNAFYNWIELEELYLHENVYMSTNIFKNNKSLRKLSCPKTTVLQLFYSSYEDTDYGDDYYTSRKGSSNSSIRYYQIPKTLKEVELINGDTVETGCFSNLSTIESISLSSSIRSFSKGSFYGLTNLKTVYFTTQYNWTYSCNYYTINDSGTISKATMNSPTGLAAAIKKYFPNSEYSWSANDGK